MMTSSRLLCGLDNPYIREFEGSGCGVHLNVLPALRQLRQAALEAGFELRLASGFRDYGRQLAIWNLKAGGLRPVLDECGQVLELAALADVEKVFAILRWSALPGASRHHWGTDIDVYDAAAVAADYRLQLTPDEYCDGGPFTDFTAWLDQRIAADQAFGFVRPYGVDRGGVAPEPWHLSYGHLARDYQSQLDTALLRELVASSEMLLKETVLEHLEEIFVRFIAVPADIYTPDKCTQ